jgi:uncharacterized membrane protein YgcG
MRRIRVLLAALLVAGVVLPFELPVAHAAPDRSYVRYDQEVTLNPDGSADVTLYADVDFRRESGRGPVFAFITGEATDSPNRYRPLKITDFSVTSPTGANTHVGESEDTYVTTFQVGMEDQWYNDIQEYVVHYTINGIVDANHPSSGLDEFNWSAIGNQGDMPIEDPTVLVIGPVDVSRAACFVGGDFSEPCDFTEGDKMVLCEGRTLQPGEGMQVVAGFPVGTFTDESPELMYTPTFRNAVWPNALYGLIGVAVLVLGILGIWLLRRKLYAPEYYVGIPLGTTPAPGESVQKTRGELGPIAVSFTPPPGMRPGETEGLLMLKGKKAMDATLIDLAVRGHLTIEPLDGGQAVLRLTGKDGSDLVEYEVQLLAALFPGRNVTRTAELKNQRSVSEALTSADTKLYRRYRDYGWLAMLPWQIIIAIGAVAFFVGGIGLAKTIEYGIGAPFTALMIVGVFAIASVLNRTGSRFTAEGSAAYAQAQGFKKYLATAEADQLQLEADQDIFSKYLPWAVAFGVADHWTKLFNDLAAQGSYTANLDWMYGTTTAWQLQNLSTVVSSATHSFNEVVKSADSYARSHSSSSSSGGSGFSGGGGHGGGGSSSW